MGIFQQIASTAQPSSQNSSVSFPPPVQNTQDQSTGVTGPMPQGKGAGAAPFAGGYIPSQPQNSSISQSGNTPVDRSIAAAAGGPNFGNAQNTANFGQTVAKGASGQKFTYSPTSGQPAMGQPNRYANTVSQWDNASIQRPAYNSGGKGKG